MKTIVFLNTQHSGSSREAIRIAHRMGYCTILMTNRLSHVKNQDAFPDVTKMIYCDTSNIGVLKNQIYLLKEEGFDIITVLSFIDPLCSIASQLSDELGVGCFTTEAIKMMENKKTSRSCLKNTVYIPKYEILSSKKMIDHYKLFSKLPCILKNPQSTGSKDVYFINNIPDFHYCFNELANSTDEIILEEYLRGPQYLVETLVINKKVHIIAIIEQEIMLFKGHFIVIGYHLRHHLSKMHLDSLKIACEDIITCHGMENGACHFELRYVREMWKLVEVNPRISGAAMNDIILYGLGINLIEQTIRLAIKEPYDLEPKYQLYINAQFLISRTQGRLIKVTGRTQALESPGAISVFIKPRKGQFIHTPISMGYRYAHVIANGESELDAKIKAKNAASYIRFHIQT